MVSQQPSQRHDEEQASLYASTIALAQESYILIVQCMNRDIDEQDIGQWGFRNDIEVPNRHKTVNYIKERFERSRECGHIRSGD